MRYPGFIGPSATNRSVAANAERTINFYPEYLQPGTPKSGVVLHGTPGVRLFATIPGGPVRGLWHQDGRCFAVAGTGFYELYADGTAELRGTVEDSADGDPATIVSNGPTRHVLIVSGGRGYIFRFDTNTLEPIEDATFPDCVNADFLDQYFVALQRETGAFFLSNLADGFTWFAIDAAERSFGSDITRRILVDHRELWLFGSKTTEVWTNTGDADFPLAPIPGVFIERGIDAIWSAVKLDNSVFWLGAGEHGGKVAYRAQGFTPIRISTHACEYAWSQYARTDNAIAWTYEDEGHSYYVLYFPSADTTWVFDIATNLWHERAHWNPNTLAWEPHVGRCHAYAFGLHLIGDRRTGAIYELSLDFLTDELVVVS